MPSVSRHWGEGPWNCSCKLFFGTVLNCPIAPSDNPTSDPRAQDREHHGGSVPDSRPNDLRGMVRIEFLFESVDDSLDLIQP
jgi:hypothetical protein